MQRREGLAKLSGREQYVDDLPLEGFLWGMTVRSRAPRGRITAIRFGKGVNWSDVVVVSADDIPGPNGHMGQRVEDDTHVASLACGRTSVTTGEPRSSGLITR